MAPTRTRAGATQAPRQAGGELTLRARLQFADDPFQKKTAAILEKAAQEVEQCSDRQRACFA